MKSPMTNPQKYSADEAFDIADGLIEGDAMAAAKTLAIQARFYHKEYEAWRKIAAKQHNENEGLK